MLRQALLGSLAWLGAHQEEINRLNVFPVPDGDTGTNMLLTLQSAVEDIRESAATEVHKVARIAAHGSLMGARGNSGVILSQIFRGFGTAVQGKAELNAVELAEAFEEAANAAYRAVHKPTEGTILSVARQAGRSAMAAAQQPGATPLAVLRAAAAGARAAVERTPSQLKILREAGVVDAGGYGLQIMLEGMLSSVEEVGARLERRPPPPAAQVRLELPEEGWGYCTEFLIQGSDLDVDRIRDEIAALGNSVLVVGDPELVKVHVHTDDPSRVILLASGYGTLDRLSVGDMSSQHRRIRREAETLGAPQDQSAASDGGADSVREEPETPGIPSGPLRANGVGLVAVVSGRGLIDIFRSLGVDAIVAGGQTMNPSTQDMLLAVDGLPYSDVILLPNSKNVVMAADQVSQLTSKNIHVLDTQTVPQGIAAVVAFNPERPLAENVAAMWEAAQHVQTIEITHAVRDSRSNGIAVRQGDVIALINDRLAWTGRDYGAAVRAALEQIGASGYELVTVYRGSDVGDGEAEQVMEAIRACFPGLEVELQDGGQQHYPFILSVE